MFPSNYNQLKKLKNPFFATTELRHLLKGSDDSLFGKMKRLTEQGHIIRIRRGLYCLGKLFHENPPHPFMLSERIYGPSVISLESALMYHGLIPEAVKIITAVTPRRRHYFKTPLGDFSYEKTPMKNFMQSVERVNDENIVFFMATPWRAIVDFIFCYKKDWSSLHPLVENLRIDLEELPKLTQKEADLLLHYYHHHKRIDQFLAGILKEQK